LESFNAMQIARHVKRFEALLINRGVYRQSETGSPKQKSSRLLPTLAAISLTGASALAQSPAPGGMPPPTGMSLATSTAMRFPQPVRVGDLLNRDVLQPVESQNVIGMINRSIL
jgi:hypothetical protein